ncbi:hypothetical protein, partial [Faecalibaculum rodentium]|uniref:hypothetical protein n=1 Tax=Faecalibaculum rodentium TaxID=1702221 RepID=UPI0025790D30
PPYTDPYVRWCEREGQNYPVSPCSIIVARVMAVKRQIHSEDADRSRYKKTLDFSGVHSDDGPNVTIL